MKDENLKKLVEFLSEFIKNDDFTYSPKNTQYSWYIEIFLDENKNGNRLHIDRFSEELARRLIADEQIQELDSNAANYDPAIHNNDGIIYFVIQGAHGIFYMINLRKQENLVKLYFFCRSVVEGLEKQVVENFLAPCQNLNS